VKSVKSVTLHLQHNLLRALAIGRESVKSVVMHLGSENIREGFSLTALTTLIGAPRPRQLETHGADYATLLDCLAMAGRA